MILKNDNIEIDVNSIHLLLLGFCLLFGILKMLFCYLSDFLVDNVWRF